MEDLFSIYCKWSKKKNFNIEISYRTASKLEFIVRGEKAYEEFLLESGGHRFQRVSPTERKGRRHTSTITVAVLPLIKDKEVEVNDKDLKWAISRASKKGGQNVNKLETAVVLTHIPTGLSVSCQDERSQKQNKNRALEILYAKLSAKYIQETANEENRKRKLQIGCGQRGDKIRTYREQDGLVKDHNSNKKARLSDVLSGNLDLLR